MRAIRLTTYCGTRASVFVARESGRSLGAVPEEIAVSVITAAELELGVLRADGDAARATRLSL
ncbi:MAG: hypothetical protein BroJett022_21240 [Actinomycetes bacterium]|nr:MAG: hypothetical protein BroJett022_21240 [Actinomycetes bacterium]